jgi:hypothetical protein
MRPRKPFGNDHPGRVPATMMKVLAAESADPQRLRRGKAYAASGAVLDIDVQPGLVTVEVQGSRPTPYVAEIAVRAGDGMPLRRDLWYRCTCPDDAGTTACKHVLAGMFALSDEFLLEPELLDVWRGRNGAAEEPDPFPGDAGRAALPASGTPSGGITRGHLTLLRSPPADARPPRHDLPDGFFDVPAGQQLPEPVALDPLRQPIPRSDDLAAVLSDALGHLRIDWD